MSTIDISSLKDSFSAAMSAVNEAAAAAEYERGRLRELREARAANDDKLRRYAENHSKEVAASYIAGVPAPAKPKRDAAMQNTRDDNARLDILLPVQEGLCGEADRREKELRANLATAVLPAIAGLRLTALAECERPLNDLFRALATVAAIDKLQDHLVGREFSVGPGVDPRDLFSGRILFSKLQEGMSPRLRELLSPHIADTDRCVDAIAADLLQQLHGDPAVAQTEI